MNSLQSACSFAKGTPMSFDELEEEPEPFLGCEISVKLIISRIGIFKTTEHVNDALHRPTLPSETALRHREWHRWLNRRAERNTMKVRSVSPRFV
jgi:hypothetical protein